MFGAPKKKGWYCFSCDTSNQSKDQICKGCERLRDGIMVKPSKKKVSIADEGKELTAEEVRKLHE